MDRLLLKQRCEISLEGVSECRKLLDQVLKSTVSEKKLRYKITLCLSEALTNIIEHGEPAATKISIRFGQHNQNWQLDLIDNSGYFLPPPVADSSLSLSEALTESGRGMGLIHENCEHIKYHSAFEADNNLLSFSWPNNRQSNKPKILIAEDDPALRCLYEAYLSDLYQITLAEDGHKALDVLKSQDIDLVLSDISMPGMDGLTLRSELARQTDNELTPFIFITATEEEDMQDRATSLGIDDYIIKPITRENLIHHIERVLQRSQQIIKKLTSRINRKISQSLSPQLPEQINHWKLAARSINTGIGGGDLLLHQCSDENSLIALIDTMGHDESAKFFAYAYGGFISGLMRSSGNQKLHGDELLAHISNMAYNDDLLSKITLTGTAFNLLANGQINIASAAHPHPFLITKDSVEPIIVEGTLPGLLPDIKYNPITCTVKTGQRLAFYTDGLFESAADNEAREDLEEQILLTMKDSLDKPIDRALRLIIQKFEEIAGTPPRDDTTLVLLEPETDL